MQQQRAGGRARGQGFPQSHQPRPHSATPHRTEAPTRALKMKNISSELIFQSSRTKPLSHHPRVEVCCELGTGNSVIVQRVSVRSTTRAVQQRQNLKGKVPALTLKKPPLGIKCLSCVQILVKESFDANDNNNSDFQKRLSAVLVFPCPDAFGRCTPVTRLGDSASTSSCSGSNIATLQLNSVSHGCHQSQLF